MSSLVIEGLHARRGGEEILHGIDLEVKSGEVHAVMGPNGAGKSTLAKALTGHPDVEVSGSVRLDGRELLELPTYERAALGLFVVHQDPVELPGVTVSALLDEVAAAGVTVRVAPDRLAHELVALGVDPSLAERGINVDCSGGEKKRLETLQLVLIEPRFAILDELDSGLDVDALRVLARRIEKATADDSRRGGPLGVLAITHYRRLLDELRPDTVHVLVEGRLVTRGGPELADELERTGYAAFVS